MRIVQLTPGAGGMYCGNCLRDNALVAALRGQGHTVTLLPLYLPLTTDEPDESRGAPVFFGGLTVYLEQKSPLFGRMPRWLHRWLGAPGLLRLLGTAAAKTRPEQVGDLTLSMLRGEAGNQVREIDELVDWLARHERPDLVSLSNGLLVGVARRLKRDLGTRVAVTLQGEDSFVDALPERCRGEAWALLAERLAEADLLVAPSRYYADRMATRLGLPAGRIEVVPNGIRPEGWRPAERPPDPPVIGFLARMCREKGLDRLVEAFLILKSRRGVPGLRLAVAGGMGPTDVPFVDGLKARLAEAGYAGDVVWRPNLDHAAKQAFFREISVFSTPAHYGEAFGLYLVEAMAAGVPIVQPRTGAFPEILESSGAGLVCAADDARALADRLEEVLRDPALGQRLGRAGLEAVRTTYNSDASARRLVELFASSVSPAPAARSGG
ncbi:MAG: glycosyltransferase family 4 protein [Verrucomicrobiales bacterium]|nr:glycosyltransferase family 4 protein [Verrucomicrobiales bacterium]